MLRQAHHDPQSQIKRRLVPPIGRVTLNLNFSIDIDLDLRGLGRTGGYMNDKEMEQLVRTAEYIYERSTRRYAKLFGEENPKRRKDRKAKRQLERRE